MKTQTRIATLLLTVLALGACNKVQFANTANDTEAVSRTPFAMEQTFPLSPSEATFEQKKYDENVVSFYFQMKNSAGALIADLTSGEIDVKENGAAVPGFQFSADSVRMDQVADIVFLVDVTGTMGAFIETAKQRLKDFITTSRAQGFHTRMCISTFGDYTVKKCSRFFDNNPNDPATESQVAELISELAALRAYKGAGQDPGWPDYDENPMGALIDAAKAPWADGSQRFVILVTDAGFLYSPNNQGTIGSKAPTMAQVNSAIKSSQMKVFGVTPNLPGFNSPFQNLPGVVQASAGEFFEFSKVLAGKISLDQILGRIIVNIQTTYRVSYKVEDVPHLDPSLPVAQRKVAVIARSAERGTVIPLSTHSTMPEGRPQYLKEFPVPEGGRRESLRVFINDRETGDYSVADGKIRFMIPPPAAAKLRVVYEYEDLRRNLRLEPMRLPIEVDAEGMRVFLNGIPAHPSDFALEKDLENRWNLRIAESALTATDPYGVRSAGGLRVEISTP